MFPGDGCFLNAKLGIPGVPALDVRNQCTGFLYGLSVADAWIRGGVYRRVLLVGSEIHSTGLDVSTRGRDVAVIFGDGAGAALLEATDEPGRGVLSVHLHADGRYAKELGRTPPAPSTTRGPGRADRVRRGLPTHGGPEGLQARHLEDAGGGAGRPREERAHDEGPEAARAAPGEPAHQPDGAAEPRLTDDRVFNNIQKYGNTTAAPSPSRSPRRLRRAASGAATSWGSARSGRVSRGGAPWYAGRPLPRERGAALTRRSRAGERSEEKQATRASQRF